METCAANSWTSSNSSAENVLAEAEPLDGQDADRAAAAAQRDDDEAAVHGPAVRPEVVDPRVVPLVADEDRLVVLDDPGRDAGLARFPRLEVGRRVHAARGQRREQAVRRIDDLDREVVRRR